MKTRVNYSTELYRGCRHSTIFHRLKRMVFSTNDRIDPEKSLNIKQPNMKYRSRTTSTSFSRNLAEYLVLSC